MDFSYYNNKNEQVKLNVEIGKKWSDLNIQNTQINSIFSKIDNGDGIVSKDEYSLLDKLFKKADEIIDIDTDNILTNEELEEVIKNIDNGTIILPQLKENKVELNPENSLENITHSPNFSKQDYADLKDSQKAETVHEKHIAKIKESLRKHHHYDEKFPEFKYDIEVIYDGRNYESFVFEKNKQTFNEETIENVTNFANGDLDTLKQMKNPLEFLNAFKAKYGDKTLYSVLLSSYEDNKISKGEFFGYLYTLEQKFSAVEDMQIDSNLHSGPFMSGYSNVYHRVKEYFKKTEDLQTKYDNNELDKNQVKELQKIIKENYNIKLSDIGAAEVIREHIYSHAYNDFEYDYENLKKYYIGLGFLDKYYQDVYFNKPLKCNDDKRMKEIKELKQLIKEVYNADITDYATNLMIKDYSYKRGKDLGFNIERLKDDCKNNKYDTSYITGVINYSINGYNDTLESLNELAKATETEYTRYEFDINSSQISDLIKKSKNMRLSGEINLNVTKTNDKIVIEDNITHKKRTIDLKLLTSQLDEEHKTLFINSLNEMNKVVLWEFAKEINQKIESGTEAWDAAGQYYSDRDTIGITLEANTETIVHEMMHAMMATIIDGNNTMNEPLFKELVDTFNEEKDNFVDKELKNSTLAGANYKYCANNIHEFAAEAGCLWLSGKSKSEFTIATHFPKSYRLAIQLIEKIRSQEEGRTING